MGNAVPIGKHDQEPQVRPRTESLGSDEEDDLEYFNHKSKEEVDKELNEIYENQMRQLTLPRDSSQDIATSLESLSLSTDKFLGIVYDTRMTLHFGQRSHPERPDRIRAIAKKLAEKELLQHCIRIPSRPATVDEKNLVHKPEVTAKVDKAAVLVDGKDDLIAFIDADTYVSKDSILAGELAIGSLVDATHAAVQGHVKHAFAIVRPPGHHAESDSSMGFCLWDNVAIAAQSAINKFGLTKVVVVDWDIHHGNGIQEIFETRKDILYISLHRHPFYPGTGSHRSIGKEEGQGHSINIPWPSSGFGDGDYMMAFQRIIIPVITEYQPQLILVASGFDAAKGDPLGGTKVTPPCYHWMTEQLVQFQVPVVIALEGGYNLASISASAEGVVRALLAQPHSEKPDPEVRSETLDIMNDVQSVLADYWDCFPKNETSSPAHREVLSPESD